MLSNQLERDHDCGSDVGTVGDDSRSDDIGDIDDSGHDDGDNDDDGVSGDASDNDNDVSAGVLRTMVVILVVILL